jgi:hypothetical protein
MAEGHGGAKLLTSWQAESRKEDRKGPGQDKTTRDMLLVAYFF